MTSPELTQTEAENLTKPWVKVRAHKWQSGLCGYAGRMTYNVVDGGDMAGSTLSLESIFQKLDCRVEIVP